LGVVGDQGAERGGGVLGVAQVAGAVQRVKARARVGQGGRVADVVQPSRRDQQVSILAEDEAERAGGRGDAGGRPATCSGGRHYPT
jgi:hypothetical protein